MRSRAEDTAALEGRWAATWSAPRSPARGRRHRVLASILDFIGAGDQLVVSRLDQLALTSRGAAGRRSSGWRRRGASLYVVEPELCSRGRRRPGAARRPGGRGGGRSPPAAAAAAGPPRPRRSAPCSGPASGPVEIARRLGVSRMTVWRKLQDREA